MTHSPYTRIGIIHGHLGSGPNHWQTWLAGKCHEAGLETHYPGLPDLEHPRLDPWLQALERDMPMLDEKTALVGHSLGCAAILHWLQKPVIKAVGAVILVAPAAEKNVAQSKVAFLTPFYENVDLPAIRKKALRTDLFASDDDIWMSMADSEKMARQLGAQLHTFHNGGHLSVNAGFTTFPQVLQLIIGKSETFDMHDAKEKRTKNGKRKAK